MAEASAPTENELVLQLPEALEAPIFHVQEWNQEAEPLSTTRLNSGERFLDGVKRISERMGVRPPISKGCSTVLPGMRVAEDQVGIVLKNGQVHLRPAGAYRTTALNPLKARGAVVPIERTAGVEFDPLVQAGYRNHSLRSYRQVVLQPPQVGIFGDQRTTLMATSGTYVYAAETALRGVIDLNFMNAALQSAIKENETSKLNQPTHTMQEDREADADPQERLQTVERRKNTAIGETVTKTAEMDTQIVSLSLDVLALPGPTVPIPEAYSKYDEESLLAHLGHLLTSADGSMTQTRTFLTAAMTEVCNPVLTPYLTPYTDRAEFWKPYRDGKDIVKDFFKPWLRYSPEPDNPSLYIVYWDWLANTSDGRKLTGSDIGFRKWFVQFLELRGKWINSANSATTMDKWKDYKGNEAHPFNIEEYVVPEGGFKTFNQFFRRSIIASERPMDDTASIVSPADGGAFYLQKESSAVTNHTTHTLEEKSKDQFNLADALPCYGNSFIGGPLVDILLWFTGYHHFHAPVDGKLIHVAEYQGSYNYDFNNFDPNDPYAPKPPPDRDATAGWYKKLNKHKRTAWIFKTEDMGLVAMIAIGFWIHFL